MTFNLEGLPEGANDAIHKAACWTLERAYAPGW
jgi:hypothetical protein